MSCDRYCVAHNVQQLSLKAFTDKVQLLRKNIAGVYRKKTSAAAPNAEKPTNARELEEGLGYSLEQLIMHLKDKVQKFVYPANWLFK